MVRRALPPPGRRLTAVHPYSTRCSQQGQQGQQLAIVSCGRAARRALRPRSVHLWPLTPLPRRSPRSRPRRPGSPRGRPPLPARRARAARRRGGVRVASATVLMEKWLSERRLWLFGNHLPLLPRRSVPQPKTRGLGSRKQALFVGRYPIPPENAPDASIVCQPERSFSLVSAGGEHYEYKT